MTKILTLLGLLCLTLTVQAQTSVTAPNWSLSIQPRPCCPGGHETCCEGPGTGVGLPNLTYYTDAICNRDGEDAATILPDQTLSFADPLHVGKVCQYPLASLLAQLPAGGTWDLLVAIAVPEGSWARYNVTGRLRTPAFTTNPFALVGQIANPCTPPLGSQSVAIFPTALQLTGSGEAGSKARLDFQVASQSTPIVHTEVRTGATSLEHLDGADLTALAGMWFTVPSASGTYPFSVYAKNAAGCDRLVVSGYALTIP